VQQRARDAGLLLLTCGVHANVVRFLFPLTIEDAVFDEALGLLAQALEGAGASASSGSTEASVQKPRPS